MSVFMSDPLKPKFLSTLHLLKYTHFQHYILGLSSVQTCGAFQAYIGLKPSPPQRDHLVATHIW